MKILVNTYDTAFQNKAGGVHRRIEKTCQFIRKFGCQIDFFDKFRTKVEDYDILHAYMIDVGNAGLIKYAKSKGLKIVLSSVVNLNHVFSLRLYWLIRKIPIMTTYKLIFQMCLSADIVVVETEKEKKFVNKYFHVSESKITIIPSGVDEVSYKKDELVFEKIGKKCDYAIEVARFDQNKNQLNVIKAMAGEKEHVVFVGGNDPRYSKYYQECLKIAKTCENIHFLGWVDADSDLLKSAYSNAKAVICSSYQETFGLSILEGIQAGAFPVLSRTLPILDFKEMSGCETFDPDDLMDIRNKVKKVMNSNKTFENRDLVKSSFSWETVAKKHIDVFEGLLIK